MISMVLSLIAIAGLALAGFGVFLIAQMVSRNRRATTGVMLTVIGLVVAVIFFVLGAGVVEIQADEVGVVFNVLSGKLAEAPLGPGLHVVIPGVQEVTLYSIAQQEYTMSGGVSGGRTGADDPVEALTQDGQQVGLDVTVIYRIDPAKANEIHVKWKNRYENGLIRPTLRSVSREVLGQYDVQEIYSTARIELGQQIREQTAAAVERDGIQVVNVLVRNIDFSDEYVDSIEKKQVAQQQALEAEFRVREREQEAEQQRALARGESDAAILRATGEAEALRLINEQLQQNPLLLQWRYIEQLGGNVQLMIIPSNSPFLFDLQSLTAQTSGAVPPAPTVTVEPATDTGGGQ